MALPPLTMQASRTSQLQTNPIFSLIASTAALNDSKRRIRLPKLRVLMVLRHARSRRRARFHNVIREIALAPVSGDFAYAVGSSVQPSGPKNSSGRKARLYAIFEESAIQ